jgi:hypothetical protein
MMFMFVTSCRQQVKRFLLNWMWWGVRWIAFTSTLVNYFSFLLWCEFTIFIHKFDRPIQKIFATYQSSVVVYRKNFDMLVVSTLVLKNQGLKSLLRTLCQRFCNNLFIEGF